MLTTSGRQFADWTADYRLFSQERFDPEKLFRVIRKNILLKLPPKTPLVVAMDDSLFRKTGRKTYGVAYRRDPLGPPFSVNFIRGQRFLQVSAALPAENQPGPAQMIPIDFLHCPTPQKPRKTDPKEQWDNYRQKQQEQKISHKGLLRIMALRQELDQTQDGFERLLAVVVDGGYTNSTVLKELPHKTVLIGRIRKDAKLYFLPEDLNGRGRKRVYGAPAPTPEQLRQDESIPYQRIPAWAAGKLHQFKVKTIGPLRWRTAGQKHDLRLIVIAPLAYRLTKNSPLLYRQPAYLIVTDPKLPLKECLQMYLWRWGIEVNFRDEKHILGAGQAQVRHEKAVENVPALIIGAYAMLLLAAFDTYRHKESMDLALPKPKWRQKEKRERPSTQQLISHLRAEMWGDSLGLNNFSHFVKERNGKMKLDKLNPNVTSAVLYAGV